MGLILDLSLWIYIGIYVRKLSKYIYIKLKIQNLNNTFNIIKIVNQEFKNITDTIDKVEKKSIKTHQVLKDILTIKIIKNGEINLKALYIISSANEIFDKLDKADVEKV